MARKSDKPSPVRPGPPGSGLVVGGLGGPEDELLESGQEEVFSRTEVESGRIEHQAEAGGDALGPVDDEADESPAPADRRA